MPGKRIQIDDESWAALRLIAGDRFDGSCSGFFVWSHFLRQTGIHFS
jgi:hypothetical protein